jgi:hypothetical protein
MHFLNGKNIGLMTCRQSAVETWEHIGLTKHIADDSRISNRTKERGYIFPLYLYPESGNQMTTDGQQQRTPNLNRAIVDKIAESIALTFTPEKEETTGTFTRSTSSTTSTPCCTARATARNTKSS